MSEDLPKTFLDKEDKAELGSDYLALFKNRILSELELEISDSDLETLEHIISFFENFELFRKSRKSGKTHEEVGVMIKTLQVKLNLIELRGAEAYVLEYLTKILVKKCMNSEFIPFKRIDAMSILQMIKDTGKSVSSKSPMNSPRKNKVRYLKRGTDEFDIFKGTEYLDLFKKGKFINLNGFSIPEEDLTTREHIISFFENYELLKKDKDEKKTYEETGDIIKNLQVKLSLIELRVSDGYVLECLTKILEKKCTESEWISFKRIEAQALLRIIRETKVGKKKSSIWQV